MYPQLFNQAARIAPKLQRILSRGGSFASPFWKASQIDVPDVDAKRLPQPSVPISTDNSGQPPANPSQPVPALGGLGLFPAANVTPMNWLQGAQQKLTPPLPTAQDPSPLDTAQWPYGPKGAPLGPNDPSPLDTAQWPYGPIGAPRGVPTPQARPAEAPQPEPDTSFFMRNALMQRDPNGGDFIDPMGAQRVRGPDLIDKMMNYLHAKV
jgi:hypothetical protein